MVYGGINSNSFERALLPRSNNIPLNALASTCKLESRYVYVTSNIMNGIKVSDNQRRPTGVDS